ncbi:PKD domain-containing protein [Candidatus Peregrinibacteria bacterium]|nr:PKD domain-containing protein [Candidatus Peregrinibacteria bacterium]
MSKTFLKSAAVVLFSFLIGIGVGAGMGMASGKMEVKIGDKITLNADNIQAGSTYRWVVKKGKEILNTQTAPIFNYFFAEQGEYEVNLTVTSAAGTIQNTSIWVMAGNRYPRSVSGESSESGAVAPFSVALSTLPPISGDGRVHLIGDSKVLFILTPTRPDILEYRIDRNVFEDADGSGTANDDIDNITGESYLKGGSWETSYRIGESSRIAAEMTLVAKDGQKAKKQVEIVFDTLPRQDGDPRAVLEVTPAPDVRDQLVRLYDGRDKVAFYSRRSEGEILEYRIDKDIFTDSDGDGNPGNDIDNLNDISFKTGDVWETHYEETDRQIIAQLIAVGEAGKGSRVQRGIIFSEKPALSPEEKQGIKLVADKPFVQKGDPVRFSVEGLTQAPEQYSFSWDFDGDGAADKEIEGENAVEQIYEAAGFYAVKVKVADKTGNAADFNLDMLVKDVVSTLADFEFETDGNTVKFTDKSVAAMNLANQSLDYRWSFGDTDPEGYASQKTQIGEPNPSYTYKKAGKYVVTLTVTDADSVIKSKSAEIDILQDLSVPEKEAQVAEETPPVSPAEGEEAAEGGSIILKILKVILYLILVVIVLAVLIVLGFLVFLKAQNPGMTFDELIERMKLTILTALGVHEMIEPVSDVPTPSAPMQDEKEEVLEGEVEEPKKETENKDGGGLENSPPHPENPGPAPLDKQTGPVPDWLKNVK